MKERDDPVNRLLRGVEAPPAPPELRTRSLQRARVALSREPGEDPWRRAWENRLLRWAWAAAIVVLTVANLALPGWRVRGESAARMGAAPAFGADEHELAAVVALPRIDGRHLETGTPTVGQSPEQPRTDGSHRKENQS